RLCERRFTMGNVAGAALLLAALAWVPRFIPTTRHTDQDLAEAVPHSGAEGEPGTDTALPSLGHAPLQEDERPPSRGLAKRIARLRKWMALRYATAGSNIDTDLDITDSGDILRYLPRALLVGWFAPFPEMWLRDGHELGAAARTLSGVETLG